MGRGEGFGSAKDAKHAKKCEVSRMWSWSHCRIHAFAAQGCASDASGCSRHPASRTTRTSCTSQDAQERPAFATAWMPEVEQRMEQLPDPTYGARRFS